MSVVAFGFHLQRFEKKNGSLSLKKEVFFRTGLYGCLFYLFRPEREDSVRTTGLDPVGEEGPLEVRTTSGKSPVHLGVRTLRDDPCLRFVSLPGSEPGQDVLPVDSTSLRT